MIETHRARLTAVASRGKAITPYPAGSAIIMAYFFFFVTRGLYARFAEDDMMNIYYYWSKGWLALLKGLILFFTTYYRPMGGLFYNTLYHFFGLNPFPYHVAITALLLANTYLAYRFATHIAGKPLIAGFCALIVAYHAQLAWLVYRPSFIYDVLCFTFYFLAFNYYLAIRSRGELLSKRQMLVFCLLYIGALESKEMAVTLPVMVLIYEGVWHGPARWRVAPMLAWCRKEALPALLGGALTAVYIAGKVLGPDALTDNPAYRSVFTWGRYVESTARFLNTLFYQSLSFGFFRGSGKVLLIWAVLLYIAWRRREKHLLFLWFFILITPLPITFVPDRGGACLYIPLVGWAVIIATLFLGLVNVIVSEPLFRRAPLAATRTVLVLLGVALLWRETIHQNKKIMPSMEAMGRVTWSVIQQLRAMQPRVEPNSKVIFLNNVFEGYDVKFIAELTFRDHTVNVWLQDHQPLPQAEIEKMNYVFKFENGKIVRVKPA